MTDIAGMRFSPNQGLPVDLPEPDLVQWAEQKTVSGKSDTPLVRIGACLFWAIVAALLVARIFVVDPAKLHPAQSSAIGSATTPLTSNPKL